MLKDTDKNRRQNMANVERRYENIINHYLDIFEKDSDLSKENRESLLRYRELGFGRRSDATIAKNLQVIYALDKKLGKDFKEATRTDMEKIIGEINNDRKLSDWTKQKYVLCIRRFYRWLFGCKKNQFPPAVDWIETEKVKKPNLNADSLWTPEDVRGLIAKCSNVRDRFLISLLYDCGCRSISELEHLNVEDIKDKGSYMVVSFQFSKTNARSLPVINSLPYFREYRKWLEERGMFKNGYPLFIEKTNGKTERLAYSSMRMNLQRAAAKTGITKKKNLHFFRKSCASLYAKFFGNSVMLDRWFGWGSGIKDLYVATNEASLLAEYKKFYESDENALKPLRCPECNADMLTGYLDFCNKCGSKLTKTTALSEEIKHKERLLDLLEAVEQDKEASKALIEILQKVAIKSGKREELLAMAH